MLRIRGNKHIMAVSLFIMVLILITGTLILSLAKNRVIVINDDSFLDGFEVIDNEVHIYCVVSLKNNSSDSKKVKILGDFQEEVAIGLLKENELEACNTIVIDGNSTLKYINIEFVGEYAGNAIMSSRRLPQISVVVVD